MRPLDLPQGTTEPGPQVVSTHTNQPSQVDRKPVGQPTLTPDFSGHESPMATAHSGPIDRHVIPDHTDSDLLLTDCTSVPSRMDISQTAPPRDDQSKSTYQSSATLPSLVLPGDLLPTHTFVMEPLTSTSDIASTLNRPSQLKVDRQTTFTGPSSKDPTTTPDINNPAPPQDRQKDRSTPIRHEHSSEITSTSQLHLTPVT